MTFPELKVKIPPKKPKEEELSGARKEYNKKLRSKRVVSEHATGKMRSWGQSLETDMRNMTAWPPLQRDL